MKLGRTTNNSNKNQQTTPENNSSPITNLKPESSKRVAVSPIAREVSTKDKMITKSDLISLQNSVIKAINESIDKKFTSFKSDIQNSIKKNVKIFQKKFTDIEQNVSNLQNTCTNLNNCIHNLSLDINYSQQQYLYNDIIIANVPRKKEENLTEIVCSIGNKLGVDITERDIIHTSRIFTKNRLGIQPVLVQFSNFILKKLILQGKKDTKISSTELDFEEDYQIYIHHHLTHMNKILLSQAREFKKRHKFDFVWYSKGSIFLRKDSTSQIINIKSPEVLTSLEESFKDLLII